MLIVPLLWTTLMSEVPINPTDFSQEAPIMTTITSKATNKENYLPRRLYPGTYKNYCGPTPEINIGDGCRSHGWHGDEALDPVDDACRLHDISYCSCESKLAARKGKTIAGSSLSSVVALRYVTRPALSRLSVDQEFFDCIHQADVALIEKGIQMRGEEQRSNCKDDGLDWFCKEGGTLSSFENFNLKIFLNNLDNDEKDVRKITKEAPLTALENNRKIHIREELSKGKTLSAAVLSETVRQDEENILQSIRKMELQ